MKKLIRNFTLLFIIFILTVSMMGCSSGLRSKENSSMPTQDENYKDRVLNSSPASEEYEERSEAETSSEHSNQQGMKIIKSSYIEVETLDFDKAVDTTTRRVSTVGGYIENSSVTGRRLNNKGNEQNRRATFRLSIPEQRFEEFKLEFGSIGNIIRDENHGENITERYFDTEAHVKSLQIQDERLLEILKKSGDIKSFIELERELSNVRYKIENLTGTLRKWDNLVNYATIDLEILEVRELKEPEDDPVTLGEKMSKGFVSSLESIVKLSKEFLVILAVALPYLIIISVLLAIGLYIKIKLSKRNK